MLANVDVVLAKSAPPAESARYLERASELFPYKQAFRLVGAYNAVRQVASGCEPCREPALTTVAKALKTAPNSAYLRAAYEGMRR